MAIGSEMPVSSHVTKSVLNEQPTPLFDARGEQM